MKPFLNFSKFTIPAGQTVALEASGSVFICKESADQFQMRFDTSPQFPMEAGLGFRVESGEFKSLSFINATASDIAIEFYAGTAQVIDARLNTVISRLSVVNCKVFPTSLTAYDATLGAGAEVTIAANALRKQLVVTNLDPNLDLDLRAVAGGTSFDSVFPRSKWTVETTGAVTIYNPNGSGVAYRALEVVYTS